jgi:ribosomal RNA-processing protein 12
VTSTKTLSKSAAPPADLRQSFGIDQETGKENMEYLKTLAADMLAVLFNVFSSVPREQRGMVGDVISLWLSVMSEEVSLADLVKHELTSQDVTATYNRVTDHLGKALTSPVPAQAGTTPLSHTMLDLLIILVPHLPVECALKLFAATQTSTLLEHSDATVQKKSYRILARLIDSGKVAAALQGESVDGFVKRVEDVGPNVGPGAQRVSDFRVHLEAS